MAVTQVMEDEIVTEEQPAVVEETTGAKDSPEAAESKEVVEEAFVPVGLPKTDPNLATMPDGRTVTASEAVEHYKSLQGDYTKKAQELSESKKQGAQTPWDDPNWSPKTDNEVYDAIKAQTKAEILAEQSSANEAQDREKTKIDDRIAAELNAIREVDKDFDEDALFKYANDRSISSLITAYNVQKEIEQAGKTAETRALKNVKARGEDPLSEKTGSSQEGFEYPEGLDTREKIRYRLAQK